MIERSGIRDEMRASAGFNRDANQSVGIRGHGFYELFTPRTNFLAGPRGMVLAQYGEFDNLVTQVGDQFYGDRAAAIGSIAAVTGMRLGTGAGAVAKTSTGSLIATYVTASNKAIDATWPQSSIPAASRRIQWKTTWNAGEATATGIAEVVITNENPLTNVTGSSANTISRALISPTVNKGASDTLAVTWNHDLLGA